MLYVERRNSEEMSTTPARIIGGEEERDAVETIYEKVARLEEENRLLRLKVVELLEIYGR